MTPDHRLTDHAPTGASDAGPARPEPQHPGPARVTEDAAAHGIELTFASRGPAHSVEEAAENLGITPGEIVKTLVAQAKATQSAAGHTYVIALIPGDKQVDWAKLRKLAGFKKMSMASPEAGLAATGYHPGTITPFGAMAQDGTRWPIFADASITGRICMGAGEKDLNLFVQATELIEAYGVTVGDIAK